MDVDAITQVDVLVAGGGPAGLLTAEYMAARWRVVLIDRGTLGRTTKYWVTSERRLKLHGLAECILHRAPAMILGTFLGGTARARGDLAVVDDQALLRLLIGRCRDAGVVLAERTTLLSLDWTATHIDVKTSGGRYRARLVVDATGGLSPIATTFRLHRLDGFYAVYGARLRGIVLHTDDIVLAFVEHLGDPPPILEVIPCGDDSAYCAVFTYSRQLSKPQTLEAAFRQYCRHNRFFSMTPRTTIIVPKMGAIPIGHMRPKYLPGIAAVGEAALVQPPLLGTGFDEILEYSRPVSLHLSDVLGATDGVPAAPNYHYPVFKRVQDRLQLQLCRMLLRGNVEALDRLVRFTGSLPEGTAYNLCSNELTWPDLLSAVLRLPRYMLASKHHWPDRA